MKANLIYTVLGVFFNTFFPIIVYPYITRVLGVASLGEYNLYASTVAYLALFSVFGTAFLGTKEIGRLKDDKTAYSKVFCELVTINLITSFIVYLVILGLVIFSDSYQNVKLLFITSLSILSGAIGAEYFFVAMEKQKFVLIRNIIFKALSVASIFLFVHDGEDLLIYALIMLVSTAGVSITNIFAYKDKIDWSVVKLRNIEINGYFFPLLQVFTLEILIHYYGMMDIVLLGNLDTKEAVGYYSVGQKIYALSYSFLAATAVPLLPRASYYIEHKMMDVYNNMIQRCYDIYMLFVIFSSFVLFYFSEEIITLIAGDDFYNGFIPLRWLSLALFFSSMCNFFIFQVFYPKDKGNLVLKSLFLSIILNVILNFFLIPNFSYIAPAIAFLVSYITLFLIMLKKGWTLLPRFKGWCDMLKEILGVLACIVLCVSLTSFKLYFIINILFCCILFISVQLLTKNTTVFYFIKLVVTKFSK